MRILVTGGAGFIGSAVCRHLVQQGDTVINLDKLTYASTLGSTQMLKASGRYTLVEGDVADATLVTETLQRYRPDAAIHLAAESHVDRSIDAPESFIQTNVVGTFALLNATLSYWRTLQAKSQEEFRFLHVSTDEVYGSLGETGLFSETTAYDPRSPYAASKAASDHLVSAWGHTYGLPILLTNCSNNYGPYHFPEKLIPLTILNALQGKPLPVYGDGANIRDWLYVEDHAKALNLILRRGSPGQSYNVGGGNERTNLDVVREICLILDEICPDASLGSRTSLIRFVADRPGHDARYAIDASKLERTLGWRAEESFETGLRKTVEWYLRNADWWEPLRQRYAGTRLGLSTTAQDHG